MVYLIEKCLIHQNVFVIILYFYPYSNKYFGVYWQKYYTSYCFYFNFFYLSQNEVLQSKCSSTTGFWRIYTFWCQKSLKVRFYKLSIYPCLFLVSWKLYEFMRIIEPNFICIIFTYLGGLSWKWRCPLSRKYCFINVCQTFSIVCSLSAEFMNIFQHVLFGGNSIRRGLCKIREILLKMALKYWIWAQFVV